MRYPLNCRYLVCKGEQRGAVKLFQFMSANQAVFPIAAMARMLACRGAGYHGWRQRELSVLAVAEAALLKQISPLSLDRARSTAHHACTPCWPRTWPEPEFPNRSHAHLLDATKPVLGSPTPNVNCR